MSGRWFQAESLLCAVALSAGMTAALAQSRVSGSVSLADGRTFEGAEIKSGSKPGEIRVEKAGSTLATATPRDLVSVEVPGDRERERPPVPNVRLANGDLLQGKLKILDGRRLEVQTRWNKLIIPFDWVSAIALQPEVALPPSAPQDTVILEKDRIQGPIQEVNETQVVVQIAGQRVPLKLEQVRALVFAPHPLPAPQETEPVLQIRSRWGERVTGAWLPWDGGELRLQFPWGQEQRMGLWAITRFSVKDGKLVYVSDLQPTAVKEETLLSRPSPFQMDRSVSGLPLRLRGKTYAHGIGVHSRSDLTFALDGSFKTFAATVGVDDAVIDQGSVIFRVYGDDKLLYESPLVHGSGDPIPVRVPLQQTLSLRLEVDYGDNADLGDHADWADARLLRE